MHRGGKRPLVLYAEVSKIVPFRDRRMRVFVWYPTKCCTGTLLRYTRVSIQSMLFISPVLFYLFINKGGHRISKHLTQSQEPISHWMILLCKRCPLFHCPLPLPPLSGY